MSNKGSQNDGENRSDKQFDSKDNKKEKRYEPHLWIPDSEVHFVEHVPTGRAKKLNINHAEHGKYLYSSMQKIKNNHNKNKTPISDDVIIFKVQLHDDIEVDKRGDYERIFTENNLQVNALKKSNIAVVSSAPENIKILEEKLDKYIENNGKKADFFQYIQELSEVDFLDKKSKELMEVKDDARKKNIQDIQIKLVPKLNPKLYDKIFSYLEGKIKEANGDVIGGLRILPDNSPIIRALVPSSGINLLLDQEIVLDIDVTPFFGPTNKGGVQNVIDISDIPVRFEKDPREMPIVCILDDGINLPDNMRDCIAGRWKAADISLRTTCEHGTKVASCAIFGENLKEQILNKELLPRVRVIDAIITDGISGLSGDDLIRRIEKAIIDIKGQTKIFCLAFNRRRAINEEKISDIASSLDVLMKKHNVQFVFPTGNHDLWKVYRSLNDLLDDDDVKIATPAESFFGLTVGSIARGENSYSLSRDGEVSPFSRLGLGFSGSIKPDLVYPGGNVYSLEDKHYITSDSIYVITKTGKVRLDFGTSFAAPFAAADLALLTEKIPEKNPLIAKALLIHHAEKLNHFSGEETLEETELLNKMYGRGIGNYEESSGSYRNKATYIRKGKMSRLEKQRVQFYMPSTIAAYSRKKYAVTRVAVTCICVPPLDKNMGPNYLRAYIDTSLHCINSNNKRVTRNPDGKDGRKKWNHMHHFSKVFTTFNPGDWQIWLQLYSKPDFDNDEEVDYVLIVSIEDLTNNDADIYGGILNEAFTRFNYLTEVNVEIENEDDA
ncbi:TPA: S8 family peptidase [Bacillus cereus]|nr:S8 family peptidase [Bacillus cereus]